MITTIVILICEIVKTISNLIENTPAKYYITTFHNREFDNLRIQTVCTWMHAFKTNECK